MPVWTLLWYWEHNTEFLFRRLAIIMPDDVAEEKVKALLALGADVEGVRPASIVDKKQVCVGFRFSTATYLMIFVVCCEFCVNSGFEGA